MITVAAADDLASAGARIASSFAWRRSFSGSLPASKSFCSILIASPIFGVICGAINSASPRLSLQELGIKVHKSSSPTPALWVVSRDGRASGSEGVYHD
jgi:hypothetical protein